MLRRPATQITLTVDDLTSYDRSREHRQAILNQLRDAAIKAAYRRQQASERSREVKADHRMKAVRDQQQQQQQQQQQSSSARRLDFDHDPLGNGDSTEEDEEMETGMQLEDNLAEVHLETTPITRLNNARSDTRQAPTAPSRASRLERITGTAQAPTSRSDATRNGGAR